jgi:hypothetical protein
MIGDDERMQGIGCPGGCQGADGQLYEWVQGIDGLGAPVGYWRTRRQQAGAPYARNAAPFLGEIAHGGDGNLYQWVQGVDGLGSPFGFWKRLRNLAKRALPVAKLVAPFVPGASAALTVASPFLRKVGVAGADGLGALYAAPDGSMYQVQGIDAGADLDGFAADDELRGLSDDELHGLAADDALNGFGAEAELNGFGAGQELDGFAADDDLRGFADDAIQGIDAGTELDGIDADDELHGVADDELRGVSDDSTMNGYVRGAGMSGVEGFRPDGPRQTPPFSPSPNAPMWAPLW